MSSPAEYKKWFALYVSSRQEKKVKELLLSKSIEVYVPIIKTLRQWSDRKKMVELPLLPGYVFVHVSEMESIVPLETRGVVGYVKHEGRKAMIRDYEIENLQRLVQLGYHLETQAIERNYQVGDKIRISSGVLKGVEGFIMEIKENKFIDIVLESIGQKIRARLPEGVLMPV